MANVPVKLAEATTDRKHLGPAVKGKLPKFDNKVKSAEQPLVTCIFDKEVVLKGRVLATGAEHDVPLDFAHSMHGHLVNK